MNGADVYPAPWDMHAVAWDPRCMVLIPKLATSDDGGKNVHVKEERQPQRPKMGTRIMAPRPSSACALQQPLRCNAAGCTQVYSYSMQSCVRPTSVWCPQHRPCASTSLSQQSQQPQTTTESDTVMMTEGERGAAAGEDAATATADGGAIHAHALSHALTTTRPVTAREPAPRRPARANPRAPRGGTARRKKAKAALGTTDSGVKRATGLKAFLMLRDASGTGATLASMTCRWGVALLFCRYCCAPKHGTYKPI